MAPFRMLVLAALLALAQQQPRDGSIDITVRDSLTRRGIPAVQFTLVYFPAEPPNEVTTHFTDGEGRLVIRNLAHGNYVMRIVPDGYSLAVRSFDGSAVTIALGPDRRIYQSEIVLLPIATLAGRVRYPNGDPFPKAPVSLLAKTYTNGLPMLTGASQATAQSQVDTDERGVFRFTEVIPGEYYIKIENSDAENLPRFTFYPGVTDSALAVPITVRGNDLSADVQLPRQPVFKISGTVINSLPGRISTPLFYFGSANPNNLETPILMFARTNPASNPNETRFEISGIAPGAYFLYPLGTLADYSSGPAVTNRTMVTIDDRDVEDLRIVLKPNVALSGKLVVDGDTSSIRPESVRVALGAKERLPYTLQRIDPMGASVSQTGEFAFTDFIPDGRFAVRVNGLPPDAYVSDVRQDGRSVFNEGFIRSNPSDGLIEVHVDVRGGTISGSVRDVTDQPAKQTTVIVIPDAPRRANSLLYKRATTDANGAFSLRGMAPGDYHLFAWTTAPPQGAEEDARFLLPYEGKGVLVRVTPGGKADTQLRLLQQ